MTDSTAKLLVCLAKIEYSQPRHCIQSIKIDPESSAANIKFKNSKSIHLNKSCAVQSVYQMFHHEFGEDLCEPSQMQPDITDDPQQTWPNLLDDLGSYYNVFSEESPSLPIQLLHLSNHHSQALITLIRGSVTYRFSYDYSGYPAALPVSLTYLILNPDTDPFEPELNRILK